MHKSLLAHLKSLLTILALSLSLLTNAQTPDGNGTVYVKPSVTGNGDGSSWDDATDNLQGAIDAAGTKKVFVAIGNYPAPSLHSFTMKHGVSIYGGFVPESGIVDLDDERRILPTNIGFVAGTGSILDGKNERPVILNLISERNIPLTNTDILNGFTITNGKGTVYGGGIYCGNGSPTLSNLLITGNFATRGGGIFCDKGNLQVINSIITNNTANSTTADNGSGVFIYSDNGFVINPVFTNVLIAGNPHLDKASEFVNMGNTVLNNVTIVDVGISKSAVTVSFLGHLYINNSVIFGGLGGFPFSGDINSNYTAVHSLIDVQGISDIDVFTNPSGGDYTLKAGSPAINTGEKSLFAGLDENTRDLAGNLRIYDFNNNGIIDLGVYESSYKQVSFSPTEGIIYVKETGSGDESGSSWENATSRLQQAIDADGVQQVWVAVGKYNVAANSFEMKNDVAIYGGFDPEHGNDLDARTLPSSNNLQGSILNGLNSRSVIENFGTIGSPINNTAILDGFIITGGNSSSDGGGGIYNKYASPTLRNLLIKENTARWDGGGIYNNLSSSPVMDNVIIANNQANYGGGMFNKEASSPVMHNVDIHKNKSANDGGGMYNDVSASPVLTNVALTGNIAQNGGGIYNRNNSSPSLTNVTIADNTSHALYAEGGTTSVSNSILYGGITATYTAKNSLIEGNTSTANGNLNATGITSAQIFSNVATGDYSLLDNSPAIDAGNPDWYGSLDQNSKDLAGNQRVFNYAAEGIIDLGAYEYTAIMPGTGNIVYVKVNATGNGTGDSWANATQSLQGAINATGAVEVRVASGTYSVPGISFVMKNGVAVYGGFEPDNGTRTLPPSGGGTILNGLNEVPVFQNNFTESNPLDHTALLDGFTITGGKSTGKGGGMSNIYASPTLNNLLIKGNSANADGGGMYNDTASAPALTNSTIKENTANYGSGIFNRNSSPTLTNVEISGNTASSDGGGMYNDATSATALSNVIIKENKANYGGGIFNRNSSPTLTNVEIAANTTSNDGGGMYNDNSNVVFQNVAMINNTAAKNGGGFYTNMSSLNSVLTNVTLTNNTANTGSAIYIVGGALQLNNAIVYGDIAGGGTYTFNYSLIEGNTGIANGNLNATGITLTDIFTNESTGDYTLKKTSKAVDAGNKDLYMGLNADTKDLAGNARVYRYDTGGMIDLGAYESSYNSPVAAGADGIIYVKTEATGTGSGTTWENATADLQGAINTDNVLKVFVAKGTYDILSTSSFTMKEGVKIYGGFDPDQNIKTLANDRILPDASNPDNDIQGSILNGKNERTVISNRDNGLTSAALLDGFTITNGQGSDGGGIYNYYVSPTLSNLVIRKNTAAHGGGVYNTSSNPVLNHVSIINNTATTNGGGMNIFASAPEINNSLIRGNTAPYGGGVFNGGANGTASSFTNVVITGNQATEDTDQDNSGGGGIYNSFADLALTNVVISNNDTKFQGGGFRNMGGNPVLTNVSLANNTAEVNYEAIAIVEGTPKINNSIIYGTIGGAYTAQNSLIQGNTDFSKGNLNATDITLTDIFTNESTGDYTLKKTSQAVNAGSNTAYKNLDANTLDLAGNPRVFNYAGGGIIDLGAYESSFTLPPVITSFTPASGVVGSTVTITGTNFNTIADNNIIFFGATKATVTAATATSLTVTVPTGATYGRITELNTATQLAAYSSQHFTPVFSPAKGSLTTADFSTKADLSTGALSQFVAMSDLDGDGKPDLVVAARNVVSVLRNTGNGFAEKADFATGTFPSWVSVGDLDGDGKPDLAVANAGSGIVSVLRNTSSSGTISFAAKVDVPVGSGVYSVAMGDLDGDGKPDLVAASDNGNFVSVLRNTSSNGTINFEEKIDFTAMRPRSVAIGDLDGDGKPDLVIGNTSEAKVSVLRNTSSSGTIGFAARADFPTGGNNYSVAIGDLNNDGKPDLAATNYVANTISVLVNASSNGTVNFAGNVDFPTGARPYLAAIGDLDGDGKPDLAVTNYNANTVSLLRNTGSSSTIGFAEKVDLATGNVPYSVAIGDLDGDGKPDLAVANLASANVSVLYNIDSPPTFLSGLAVNTGKLTPEFDSTIVNYTVAVLYSVTNLRFTPTVNNAGTTIKVNGLATTSGTLSDPISLNVGSNTIDIVVTAQNGITTKTYRLVIMREAFDTGLLSIETDPGSLLKLKNNNSGLAEYTGTVTLDISSIRIKPTAKSAVSTLMINGLPALSGVYSDPIALNAGANTIDIVVTAQDGVTTKTYRLVITRLASDNTGLLSIETNPGSSLKLKNNNSGLAEYTGTVTLDISSIRIKPTAKSAVSTLMINGLPALSGVYSDPIALNAGANTIDIVVTAQDGVTTKTYRLVITRLASDNTGLLSIETNPGSSLKLKNNNSGLAEYTGTVTLDISSISIKPTAKSAVSTLMINGLPALSGVYSDPIALNAGANTIDIVVTAQDGVTTKTYRLVITRLASDNTGLLSIETNPGSSLKLKNNNSGLAEYTGTVTLDISVISIKPTAKSAVSTLMINGLPALSGVYSDPIALNAGANTIDIVVTAQDGVTTKTYRLVITRLASDNTGLLSIETNPGSSLKLKNNNSGLAEYTGTVTLDISSIRIKPTAKSAVSTLMINGLPALSGVYSDPIALNAGANTIDIVVTAQDGVTTKTYRLVITKPTPTFMVDKNDSKLLFANKAANPVAPSDNDGVVVHQGVSPNGDGSNDFLSIEGISQYAGNKLSIMNGNGALVFEAKDYGKDGNNLFDGHSNKNGALLKPGTYFYALEYQVDKNAKRKTGYIIIKY